MDRASQLKNVAFGGAWSQQIPRREKFADAVEMLRKSPDRSHNEDLRDDRQFIEAVDMLCNAHPKGETIRKSWERAMGIPDPSQRCSELIRLVRVIEVWVAS